MPVKCNVTNSIILYTYKFSMINVGLFTIILLIKITHLQNISFQILRQSFVRSLGSYAYLPNKNSHAGKQFLQFRKYRCHIVQARSYIPHSTIILRQYFENIPLKSCNIAGIFIKLSERFLKYCRNLAMSVQNIINGMLLQY